MLTLKIIFKCYKIVSAHTRNSETQENNWDFFLMC